MAIYQTMLGWVLCDVCKCTIMDSIPMRKYHKEHCAEIVEMRAKGEIE